MGARGKREGLTSVQIHPDLARKISFYLRKGVTKSQLINEALRQYLIEKEFQEIRKEMIPLAQRKGIYTDEDVERLFK